MYSRNVQYRYKDEGKHCICIHGRDLDGRVIALLHG